MKYLRCDVQIKECIDEIKNELTHYLKLESENGSKLCELNYTDGNIPEYKDIGIQMLYLFRYMYAYSFEYREMYETLFLENNYENEVRVLSLGCGNYMDYWGLVHTKNVPKRVQYTGVDIINWEYKFQKREQDEISFENCDIFYYLKNCKNINYDIVTIPKSMSEVFDFTPLSDTLKLIALKNGKVHLLISFRPNDDDTDKIKKIFEELNKDSNLTLKKIDSKFSDKTKYPQSFIGNYGHYIPLVECQAFEKELEKKCSEIKSKNKCINNNCVGLNRSPLSNIREDDGKEKLKHVILTLEKK